MWTVFQPKNQDHLELLHEILEEHKIPWENVYNMDKKGCDQGGGRGHCRAKYLMSHGKQMHYKFKSDNL